MNARWREWKAHGACNQVVDWLRQGVKIETTAGTPVIPQKHWDPGMQHQIDKWIQEGVIERAKRRDLKHAAPIFPVEQGTKVRYCHDLRQLNAVTRGQKDSLSSRDKMWTSWELNPGPRAC